VFICFDLFVGVCVCVCVCRVLMGFRWGFIANCYLNAVNVMYCDVSLWLLTYF